MDCWFVFFHFVRVSKPYGRDTLRMGRAGKCDCLNVSRAIRRNLLLTTSVRTFHQQRLFANNSMRLRMMQQILDAIGRTSYSQNFSAVSIASCNTSSVHTVVQTPVAYCSSSDLWPFQLYFLYDYLIRVCQRVTLAFEHELCSASPSLVQHFVWDIFAF